MDEQLSERDAKVLAFEARWSVHHGHKEQAIRDAFGIGPARYYSIVHRIIHNPAAMVHDPMLVKRLLRQSDARLKARASREFKRA